MRLARILRRQADLLGAHGEPAFDEIVVTTFTAGAQNTLPIWIFAHIRNGQQLPQVNVVVLFVILISIIPVALAQRLTRDTGIIRPSAAVPAAAPAAAGAAVP